MVDAPYRTGESSAHYVCIVCFGSASIGPGVCPHCAAPLATLDEMEVSTAVRNRAIVERTKLSRRKNLTILVPAIIISVLLFFALIAMGVPLDYTSRTIGGGSVFIPYFVISILVWGGVFATLYHRLFSHAEARLAFDPVNADLPSVIEWLGLRVEAPKRGS